MNYTQSLEYLNSFINYEENLHEVSPKDFSLDRVRKLLKQLNDPQEFLRIIHIAGSKGKGSTCAFLGSILKNTDYHVGLFTSPHIENVRERIRILGKQKTDKNLGDDLYEDMISEKEFAGLIDKCQKEIEAVKNDPDNGELTFFEILTVLAIVFFKEQNMDFVILETGLGGRLDATNVFDSMVVAITMIDLEHTHMLGSTLELITKEKMEIIKDGSQRVVLAPQEMNVMTVLKERSGEFDIEPVIIGEDILYDLRSYDNKQQTFDLNTPRNNYKKLSIPLLGEHQVINASTALGITEYLIELGFPVSMDAIYQGLKTTFWPLRFEQLSDQGNIILDGAHTALSSKALVDTIQRTFPDKTVTMIMGFTLDKDIEGMCKQFNRIANKVIATQSQHPRSVMISDDQLNKNFPNKECFKMDSLKEAIELGKKDLCADDILLISGSLYLVSEARKLCIN